MGLTLMDQMRFGEVEENHSTLLDQYERLSFEVQLNQAILFGRSLSEPSTFGTRTRMNFHQKSTTISTTAIPPHHHNVHQKRTPRFIQKLVNKLFSVKKFGSSPTGSATEKGVLKQDSCRPNKLWKKTFSRSLRRA